MIRRTFFFLLLVLVGFSACTDNDSFTTSPTATLAFSTDSVKMDTVFSTIGSRTYSFWVYNRSRAGVRIQCVRLRQGNQTGFRVNVDGSYLDNSLGSVVTDLELRREDSIRVYVELTAPENGQLDPQMVSDELVFTLESGVEQQIPLVGYAWDAIMKHDWVISSNTTIESVKPIVVYGSLKVDSAATLTLKNTTLYFHGKAGIDVYGTLKTDNAVLRGDRLDHMFDYLPYDRVSGQWRGIRIYPSSFGNELIATKIRNAEDGIVCDSTAFSFNKTRLYMEQSVVHNCKGYGLQSFNSLVGLLKCQFTNTLNDCVSICGGAVIIQNCTLGQFYPFSANRGAALRFKNDNGKYPYPLHVMQLTGSIVTGYNDDVVFGEKLKGDSITPLGYYFENNLLRTPRVDKDTVNFVNIIWETPKDSIQGKDHFIKIDETNLDYDFHLDSLSTAVGLGCYR